MIAENLVKVVEDVGLEPQPGLVHYFEYVLAEGNFKFLTVAEKSIGFVTWDVFDYGQGIELYVSYLVILPEYKGMFNLKKLITSWKRQYGHVHQFHWHNNKTEQKLTFTQRIDNGKT